MTARPPLETARAVGIRSFDQGQMLAPGQWQFDWAFALGDAAFEGHFPHQPILPAVFLMEMAQRAAEFALYQASGRPHAVRRIERFRFMQPVLPGQTCTLLIEWPSDNAHEGQDLIELRASFSKPGTRVAQGTLALGEITHAC